MRRRKLSLVIVGLALGALDAAAGRVAAQALPSVPAPYVLPVPSPDPAGMTTEDLTIPVNRAHLLALPDAVRDVIIPDPDIIDAVVKTPTEVYLVAKKIGETNLFLVGPRGNIVRHLDIKVRLGLEGPQTALKTLLPETDIALKAVNDTIVLTGNVRSAKQARDATAIVRRFVRTDDNVINMLNVVGEQQVLLKMRFAELQRTVLKTLGATTVVGRTVFGNNRVGFLGQSFNQLSISTAAGEDLVPLGNTDVFGSLFVRNLDLLGISEITLNALDRKGLLKTLAEPALVAVSGETANFLAGGEFPLPVQATDQRITFTFKQFGVSLSFTPVVLGPNQISLRIKAEVSRTSREEALQQAGTFIPSLVVRRAETTVTIGSGGRIMLAGLLQNDELNSVEGYPGLKDIPILGALFRSSRFQANESELVVLMTAYLIRPITAADQLAAPTDGFVPASDFDAYLMGRLHARYGKEQRPGRLPMVRGPIGYLME